jgi:hypothetical protein
VTIQGANFQASAVATFGTAAGTQLTLDSPQRLTVRTPSVAGPGVVTVVLRNPDGKEVSVPDAFEYVPASAGPTVDARLTGPADTEVTSSTMVSVTVTGQVAVAGVTNGAGQGAGLKAQVGFARVLSSTISDADFTWSEAAYLQDADGTTAQDLARDVYRGTFTVPGPGFDRVANYSFAVRFSANNGASWTMGDRDGSENGISAAQLAKLAVRSPVQPDSGTTETGDIDWCRLGAVNPGPPPTLQILQGRNTPTVLGQVYKKSVTNQAGAGAGLVGELGYGPAGSAPSTWSWVAAAWNADTENGANDEFQATTAISALGTYKFGYRFRFDGGTWAYCDADGTDNQGFTELQAGTVTVTEPTIGFQSCRLVSVSQSSLASGSPLAVVVGVTAPGYKPDGGASGTGPDAGVVSLRVEVGMGPENTNAFSSAGWGWAEARFENFAADDDARFSATVSPAYSGGRNVSARVSTDQGATWGYCDLNGSNVNGYEQNQQYYVNVGSHGIIDYCNLQHPFGIPADGGVIDVYGQVYEPGVTPNASAPITAQFGMGRKAEDPGLAWTWSAATFNVMNGNNNEYKFTYVPDGGVGHYAFRYSLDGTNWCYGDRDGNGTGTNAAFSGESSAGENLGVVY